MKATVVKMQAQLERWNLQIDDLATRAQAATVPASLDALTAVDELKALHAIARTRLDEFVAAGDAQRAGLKDGFRRAWSELDTALQHSGHHRRP